MGFLDFSEPVPDSSTIWLFGERLKEMGRYDLVWEEFQSQLDARGLKVSLTFVSENLDEVEILKKAQSRMLHSSNRITGHRCCLEEMMQKTAAAETLIGPRRAKKLILVISYIQKLIWIMA